MGVEEQKKSSELEKCSASSKIIRLSVCDSTNSEAFRYLKTQPFAEKVVFVAHDQQQGRGQRGNGWESVAGKNIACSLIWRPRFLNASQQFQLNYVVSLGVYDFLEKKLSGQELFVKWPNDIYVDGGKISGILIENVLKGEVIETSVVGIGLNVNQQIFENSKAVSLAAILGEEFDLEECLQELLACLEFRYQQLSEGKLGVLKQIYLSRLLWYQEQHPFTDGEKEFEGVIMGVDDYGRLAVQTSEGLRFFGFKEIKFLL